MGSSHERVVWVLFSLLFLPSLTSCHLCNTAMFSSFSFFFPSPIQYTSRSLTQMVVLNKVELRDPGGGGSRRQGGGCSSASRGDGLPLLADGSLTGSVAGVRTPRSRMQNNDRREDNFSPYLYEAIHEPPHLFQRHHPPQERNNFNRLSREDDNYTETTLFTSPSASSTTASIHPSTEEHWQHLMSSSVHEDQRTSSHRMLSSSSAPVFPVNNVHSSPPPHHTRIGGVYDPSNGGGHFISSSPEHEMDNDSHKMNITECTSFLDTKRLDRDKIEESLSLTGYFLSVLSLILFILDTGTDVLLGYFLFRSQSPWFYPTIGITLLSALIVNFFSLRWYDRHSSKCDTISHSLSPFRFMFCSVLFCSFLWSGGEKSTRERRGRMKWEKV